MLEGDLKKLRDGLVRLEHEGPDIEDADEFERNSHAISGISSDIITPESIAAIVEKATKVPVQRLLSTDKSRLLNLGNALRQQVCPFTSSYLAVKLMLRLTVLPQIE